LPENFIYFYPKQKFISMSADQNKAIVRKIFEEGINKRNLSVVEEYIGPGYVNHGIPSPKPGPEGFKEIIRQFTDSFPDMEITVEEVISDNETVATRGSWTGTNQGSFMNMPATGKHVKVSYMDFWKIENGKCVENWVQMDIAGLMQQLGSMQSS
jgi:steroid delta-isomerase-like uncharacterized protein